MRTSFDTHLRSSLFVPVTQFSILPAAWVTALQFSPAVQEQHVLQAPTRVPMQSLTQRLISAPQTLVSSSAAGMSPDCVDCGMSPSIT